MEVTIDENNIPRHVAIIMDGNGRWAKKQGKIRTFGHRFGVDTVKEIIKNAKDLGIEYLTLYAFSTENWKRPKLEVDTLMSLVIDYLSKENDYLMNENVRMDFIGDIEKLPRSTYESVCYTKNLTKDNTSLKVNIALNYGGKAEIIRATQLLCEKVLKEDLDIGSIDEDMFEKCLYTKDAPGVDLLIRTGGDIRISNFLLWQIAYSEMYFTDILWPDFKKEDLIDGIYYYQNKERRFGGLVK